MKKAILSKATAGASVAVLAAAMMPVAAFADTVTGTWNTGISADEDYEDGGEYTVEYTDAAADTNQATTTLTLQYIEDVTVPDDGQYGDADPEVGPGSDDSVKYAVPTKIPMAFKTNGDLVCARGNAYKIDNKSKMTLNMTDVTVAPAAKFIINDVNGTDMDAITLTSEEEAAAIGDEVNVDVQNIRKAAALKAKRIAASDATLSLGFTHAELDPEDASALPTYVEASAVKPVATESLTAVIPVTVNDLGLAFGGTVDNNVDITKFTKDTNGTGAVTIGALTWSISPNGAIA